MAGVCGRPQTPGKRGRATTNAGKPIKPIPLTTHTVPPVTAAEDGACCVFTPRPHYRNQASQLLLSPFLSNMMSQQSRYVPDPADPCAGCFSHPL